MSLLQNVVNGSLKVMAVRGGNLEVRSVVVRGVCSERQAAMKVTASTGLPGRRRRVRRAGLGEARQVEVGAVLGRRRAA